MWNLVIILLMALTLSACRYGSDLPDTDAKEQIACRVVFNKNQDDFRRTLYQNKKLTNFVACPFAIDEDPIVYFVGRGEGCSLVNKLPLSINSAAELDIASATEKARNCSPIYKTETSNDQISSTSIIVWSNFSYPNDLNSNERGSYALEIQKIINMVSRTGINISKFNTSTGIVCFDVRGRGASEVRRSIDSAGYELPHNVHEFIAENTTCDKYVREHFDVDFPRLPQ